MTRVELEKRTLKCDRELSLLDEMVLEFVDHLKDADVSYVIVGGYVAILTGRSRGTEDVDVIIESQTERETNVFTDRLDGGGYSCINQGDEQINTLLAQGSARFAKNDRAIPNFHLQFPSTDYESKVLDNAIQADVDGGEISISPLERQIAYKLFMGAQRDFEDALHLYTVFENCLDHDELERYVTDLQVGDAFDELRRV